MKGSTRRPSCALALLPWLACHGLALSAILRVPQDHATIQGAIDAAQDGDRVIIEPGTYKEWAVDFRGKAISVEGTDPCSRAVIEATVVDGDSIDSVVVFRSGEDTTSVLCGLTITGGMPRNHGGGGVWCDNSASPRISDCNIVHNHALGGNGGGVSVANYSGGSHPIIERCRIAHNSGASQGGGVAVGDFGGDVELRNCLVTHNRASMYGGGVGVRGRSAYLHSTLLLDNSAGLKGTSVSVRYADELKMSFCTVAGNRGDADNAIHIRFGVDATLSNCIIYNNVMPPLGEDPMNVSFSDVEGGYEGEGNIDATPLFRSYRVGSYLLRPGSPCVDAGDPQLADGFRWPPWYDNDWRRADMGAFGGPGNRGWVPGGCEESVFVPEVGLDPRGEH
ncbi:MAG: hypothetical protein CME06_16890 [Gemmatimonadetes bacterium]|nr:hypothetical protein [Gemmatimonadota bacterium]